MSTCGDTYLKTRIPAAVAALLVASGCETFNEPVFLERTEVGISNDVQFHQDLMQEAYEGRQYLQFSATNYSSQPRCVQTNAESMRYSSEYSMGAVVYLAPAETADTGYVFLPSEFGLHARSWAPDEFGNCN